MSGPRMPLRGAHLCQLNGWRFVWHDVSGVTADDGSVVPI